MPFIQPSRGDVHVNAPLTNVVVAFFQDQTNFIANRVFPSLPVSKQSDVFFTIPRGEFNRNMMRRRAPGAPAAMITHRVSNDNYRADVYALKEAIADMVRANADAPLNLDTQVTQQLGMQAMLNREITWATQFFTTSIWTTDIAGNAANGAGTRIFWSTGATSDPIGNVWEGKSTVLASTGFEPNTLVLGYEVFETLINHPDIIDRVKYGQTQGGPAMANEQILAQLFGVEQVLVAKAIRNTADEGVTDSHSFILGRSALLCYVAPNPGVYTPSAGYDFSWTGYLGASGNGTRIKRFRNEEIEADLIEIQMAYDQKLISADLGYFFSNIVEAAP